MKITWSPTALKSYFKILKSLNERWTKKEVDDFVNQTDNIIKQITENPKMFVTTQARKNVRKGFLNKLVTLFYKVYPRKGEIELLRFHNNREKPKKIK